MNIACFEFLKEKTYKAVAHVSCIVYLKNKTPKCIEIK